MDTRSPLRRPSTKAGNSLGRSTLRGTSDYVFRGISQTDNDPTIQGGLDFSYGILYAGAWASGLDFGGTQAPGDGLDAQVEIDWYGGIKPTWNSPLGTVNLDFGVIYYSYPGATDFLAERRLRRVQGGLQLVGSASEPGDRHDGVLLAGLYVRDRTRVDDRDDGRLDASAVPRLHAGHQRRAWLAEGRLGRGLLRQRQRRPTTSTTTGTPVWR